MKSKKLKMHLTPEEETSIISLMLAVHCQCQWTVHEACNFVMACNVLNIGSRPTDHYFRSVCLFVCLFVCAEFFSAVFDPIWIKLGHMLHVQV